MLYSSADNFDYEQLPEWREHRKPNGSWLPKPNHPQCSKASGRRPPSSGEMLLLLFAMILLTLAAVYLYLAYQLGMTSVNAAILLVVRGT